MTSVALRRTQVRFLKSLVNRYLGSERKSKWACVCVGIGEYSNKQAWSWILGWGEGGGEGLDMFGDA